MTRIIHYDEIKWIRLSGSDVHGFHLTVRMPEGDDDLVVRNRPREVLKNFHRLILDKFLEYKRGTSQSALQQLAQSHAALASCAARFLDEVELVPGVAGGESEAAVERCKKRARGEEVVEE